MLRLIKVYTEKIRKIIEIGRYDNFTIAEYFRRQGAKVGEGCYIVPRALGTEPYLVKIGNHVAIAAGVTFHTHDGGTWVFRKEIPDLRVFGPIVIGDNCLIGTNSHILPNVSIGENSIIAAGSVVISDIPPNSMAIGVPARRLGSIEKYKEKCVERWGKQRPPDFHKDSVLQWDGSEHKALIVEQLRRHLVTVFGAKLK